MKIGDRTISPDQQTFIIGEIGINHNGDMGICTQLIDAAAEAGFDAVKFQTRTVDTVYSKRELATLREHPWGTTNRQLKDRLELSVSQYTVIDRICRTRGIQWFTSCWDGPSVDRMESSFDVPCYKIASACLTDHELIATVCKTGKPIVLSTGMSDICEISSAVEEITGHGNELLLLHCTSSYPCRNADLNLRGIETLSELFYSIEPHCPIGYSGHEAGLTTTYAAVALGACAIERHITLDRTMFGSDQSASIEPQGMSQLVKGIRAIEQARGDGVLCVYEAELPARDKLRKVLR